MITIGTDCSGIDAPIQALLQLGIPFRHRFSCEKDPYCIETLRANYQLERLDTDITTRDPRSLPHVDLYVCGFPCQPFSYAGKRQGVEDDKGRGHLFWYCLDVIRYTKPTCVLLENVKGLLTIDDGDTFETIQHELRKLSYHVEWKILNTKEYGIPQQRERLYIVAIRSTVLKKGYTFTWPEPIPMNKLTDYIDHTDTESQPIPDFIKRAKTLRYIPKESCFIDIGFTQSTFPKSDRLCPCITTQGNTWCVPYQRKATCRECLALQGFPIDFKQVVSDRQFKKQIGNSMSVNVLEQLFTALLPLLS